MPNTLLCGLVSFWLKDSLSNERLYESLGYVISSLVFVLGSKCGHLPQKALLGKNQNTKSSQVPKKDSLSNSRRRNGLCFLLCALQSYS